MFDDLGIFIERCMYALLGFIILTPVLIGIIIYLLVTR